MNYWLKISVLVCACIGINAPICGAATQSEIKQNAQQKKSCTLADVQKKYADELAKQEQALIREFCAACKITPDEYYLRLKQDEGKYAKRDIREAEELIKKYGLPKNQAMVNLIKKLLKENGINPEQVTLISNPEHVVLTHGVLPHGTIEYGENILSKLPAYMVENYILHEIAHLKNKDAHTDDIMHDLISEKGLSKDPIMQELLNKISRFVERRAETSVFIRGLTYAANGIREFSKEGQAIFNTIVDECGKSVVVDQEHESEEETYNLAKQIYEEIKECTEKA